MDEKKHFMNLSFNKYLGLKLSNLEMTKKDLDLRNLNIQMLQQFFF